MRRRPESPSRREPPARGAILARFRRGKHGCWVASGPRSDATEPTPPLLGLLRLPRGHDPVLPVAIALRRPCLAGSGSGLQATPPFLTKNGPVVEWLSHSPPGAGGRLQPAPAARVIPAGRLPAPPAAGPGGGRRSLRGRRAPRWRRRRSGDGPRTPLAASGARSPALGSRRASAAWSKATCSAKVRSAATTPVRRCALRALAWGVRGLRPRPSGAPAAAREAGGSKGGAASPRQSLCAHKG